MKKEQSSKQDDINLLSTEKSFVNEKNEIEILKRRLITQSNIIKQYDYWLHLLLNIVDENNSNVPKLNSVKHNLHIYNDLATPIQKGLEKIEQIENENFELKKKLSMENNKCEELKKIYDRLNNQINIINEDIQNKDNERITLEKNQLFDTVNAISDELEYITQQNKELEKENINNENLKLLEEIEKLKEENNILKGIVNMSRKNSSSERMDRRKFSLSLSQTEFTGSSKLNFPKKSIKKSIFSCITPIKWNQDDLVFNK